MPRNGHSLRRPRVGVRAIRRLTTLTSDHLRREVDWDGYGVRSRRSVKLGSDSCREQPIAPRVSCGEKANHSTEPQVDPRRYACARALTRKPLRRIKFPERPTALGSGEELYDGQEVKIKYATKIALISKYPEGDQAVWERCTPLAPAAVLQCSGHRAPLFVRYRNCSLGRCRPALFRNPRC